MRTDSNLRWTPATGIDLRHKLEYGPSSAFSGHERNHLWMNRGGRDFVEVSSVSGLDHEGDSRVSVLLDYDRDGRQDVAVVNANAPLLQLFRNRSGEARGRFVAVRFVGGNRSANPAPGRACRDGYGARVTADLGDLKIVREHRCGEGFAAQNSAVVILGIGGRAEVERLSVRWPSGKVQQTESVAAGTLVTIYEDPTQSPSGKAFMFEPYAREPAVSPPPAEVATPRLLLPTGAIEPGRGPALRMYTTMATWCPSCRGELPNLSRLRGFFGEGVLGMYAVPVDPKDDRGKLREYVTEHQPPYELLVDLPRQSVEAVSSVLREAVGEEVLPGTVVTDAEGRVLLAVAGVPTVSDLRRLRAGTPR